jgi:hypothetical protein
MDKAEAKSKMHKMIDENFDEMWSRYTTIKNHIDKHRPASSRLTSILF